MKGIMKLLVSAVLVAMLVVPGSAITLAEEPRTGAWVDEVVITVEPDGWQAVDDLAVDELDVYAVSLTDADLFATVLANPDIDHVVSYGSYNEFTFNPVPYFNDGRFNPFGFPQIREAINWLVDRDHFASEILDGLAVAKYTCLSGFFVDAQLRYPHLMADIEDYYDYQPEHAANVIKAEMLTLGAYVDGTTGTWHYNGEEVEVLFLIRVEDRRHQMGDYLSSRLEGLGFQVTRIYGTMDDLRPLWLESDPAEGLWSIYTGGWMSTSSRDQKSHFAFFYTDMGVSYPLWQAYDPDPDFYEVARRLYLADFATLTEREALFEQALWLATEDSVRVWLTDNAGFSPFRSNVRLAADMAGGITGSWIWGHTAHFHDGGNPLPGGTLRVAIPGMLGNSLNPIAGSNWIYDMFWIRATGDRGLAVDTHDGLRWPHRIEKAEVTVQIGLPVGVSSELGHDWVTLSFAASIEMPDDVWTDWDAVAQRFITVGQKMDPASPYYDPGFGRGVLAKSVAYYPKDIFEVPLHDGSTLSMGDFILHAILQVDRANPQSAIYDPSAGSRWPRGLKFVTDHPDWGLIVEAYGGYWGPDAELCVADWFPYYDQGPGMWHTIALGIMAEADGQLAFSSAKAGDPGVEWTSFIAGPSLGILRDKLADAQSAIYPDNLPYAPTLGDYITEAEAAGRYANLAAWSDPLTGPGHFWVAGGPLYLEEADPAEGMVHLKRFEDYPDPADRWLFLLSPLQEEPEKWLVNLALTTNPNVGTVPGPGYSFAFGAKDGATDGYSEADGDEIAPMDAPGSINAYFRYPANPILERNLVTSVVGPAETIVWPLRVKSTEFTDDTDATLTWNPADLANVPSIYATVELRDTGGNTLADMKTEASYTFSLLNDQTRDFHVVAAQHTPPQVSNVTAEQRTDGSGIVDVTYDVHDNEELTVDVVLQYWDGGAWDYAITAAGDIGAGIGTGTDKHVTWEAKDQLGEVYVAGAMVRIIAQSTGGTSKAESSAFDLDTMPPTGYGPSIPPPGATGVPKEPELASSVASDHSPPVEYRFLIAADSGFTQDVQQSDWQIETGWTPAVALDHETSYYWKVQARDSWGNEGEWSAASTFVTTLQATYELKTGWNMVSLPLHTTETDPAVVFPGHITVYTWDADGLRYEVPAEIVPGKGYWILYFDDASVSIEGPPVEEYELTDAVAGWHMIGSLAVEADVTVTAGDIYNKFYWWNPQDLNYEAPDTLQPGRGYWLLGFSGFSVEVTPKPPPSP